MHSISKNESFDFSSPWTHPKDPVLKFPTKSLENLLSEFGWHSPIEWLNHWSNKNGVDLAYSSWPIGIKSDWVWGLGLPFLSDIERHLYSRNQQKPTLMGISGLPGCGKTSFGKWLEAASSDLHWPVTVMSLDDFYLPASELEEAMHGNPWNAPRALPGSHSTKLIEKTIDNWIKTGELIAPQFDKALRGGIGDRSGWRRSQPKVLVIEGWFLGCATQKETPKTTYNRSSSGFSLTPEEMSYQKVIQESLEKYLPLWKRFDRIWHLKAINFDSTCIWKREQEMRMQQLRGSSLQGNALESFIRMIQASIPQENLNSINSDVLAKINQNREILWIGKSEEQVSINQ